LLTHVDCGVGQIDFPVHVGVHGAKMRRGKDLFEIFVGNLAVPAHTSLGRFAKNGRALTRNVQPHFSIAPTVFVGRKVYEKYLSHKIDPGFSNDLS
jgi:hypothetical protein